MPTGCVPPEGRTVGCVPRKRPLAVRAGVVVGAGGLIQQGWTDTTVGMALIRSANVVHSALVTETVQVTEL
jgi:hypothetical protein